MCINQQNAEFSVLQEGAGKYSLPLQTSWSWSDLSLQCGCVASSQNKFKYIHCILSLHFAMSLRHV